MKRHDAPPCRGQQKTKRILIVDDDPDVRRILRKLFEPDYEVVEADDGLAAWDLMPSVRPAVLVTDIQMPRLDGLSLCQKLRDNGFQHLRIVIYSGRPVTAEESSRAGADKFLLKTEPLSRVRDVVEEL